MGRLEGLGRGPRPLTQFPFGCVIATPGTDGRGQRRRSVTIVAAASAAQARP
jgi:hypothetical protein